jgi:hypothetical protein
MTRTRFFDDCIQPSRTIWDERLVRHQGLEPRTR